MKKISRFIFGAAIGGFIGSAIVLLLAPESGGDTRAAISSRFENFVKQIRTTVDERREELKKEFENYKNSSV
jgi:gas vesicle protein